MILCSVSPGVGTAGDLGRTVICLTGLFYMVKDMEHPGTWTSKCQ